MTSRIITGRVFKFYVHGMRTVVRDMVAHQVRQLPKVYQINISAVRQVAVAVRSSQRALLFDVDKKEKTPIKRKMTRVLSKILMVIPSPPELPKSPKWEMKNLSPMYEYSSVIDVAMGLGAIMFAGGAVEPSEGTAKANEAGPLSGNKRVILRATSDEGSGIASRADRRADAPGHSCDSREIMESTVLNMSPRGSLELLLPPSLCCGALILRIP